MHKAFVALSAFCLVLTQCNTVRQVVAQPQDIVHEPRGGGMKGYKRSAYTVRGKRYVPMTVDAALSYRAEGVASYYTGKGGRSAIGERVFNSDYHAAHCTLPLPCVARVTNLSNGKSCLVRVNDRGPFVKNRLIDVGAAAAKDLGFYQRGVQRVRVEVISVGDGAYKREAKSSD